MVAAWRLLVTEPLDGATNMAIDEAILRSRIADHGPPTVRFYGWVPPTVSLGYAQPLDTGIDRELCALWGIGLVRRPTGGSAILHEPPDREVTYSVVARGGDFPGADDVLETYRLVGDGLAVGLHRLGLDAHMAPLVRVRRDAAAPTFCFARTGSYEIAVAGKKLVGSAQRRQSGAFLQHGSILLAADAGRLRAVFPGAADPLAGMTTIALALGRAVGFDDAVSALVAGLEERLGVPLAPGELSPREMELAERLVAEKYGTDAWNLQQGGSPNHLLAGPPRASGPRDVPPLRRLLAGPPRASGPRDVPPLGWSPPGPRQGGGVTGSSPDLGVTGLSSDGR